MDCEVVGSICFPLAQLLKGCDPDADLPVKALLAENCNALLDGPASVDGESRLNLLLHLEVACSMLQLSHSQLAIVEGSQKLQLLIV